MKIVKYTLAGLILMNGVNSFAQEGKVVEKEIKTVKSPEAKAEKKLKKLTTELSLNDDQVGKMESMNTDFMNSAQKIKADGTTTDAVKKSQLKALKVHHRADVRSILEVSQVTKLDQMEADKKAAHKAKRDENKKTPEERASAESQKLKEELELTDDQTAQVYMLNLKVINKIDVIRNDDSMDEAKKKEFIKGNRKDKKNALKAILTEEQFSKFEAMKAEKKEIRKTNKSATPLRGTEQLEKQ